MNSIISFVDDKLKNNPQNAFWLFAKKHITTHSLQQFVRYLAVGFSCFAVEYAIFYFLIEVIHTSKYIANSVALGIVFWCNFWLNRLWSFRSKEKLPKQLAYYGLLFFFNIFMSNVLLNLFSNFFETVGLFEPASAPYVAKFLIQGLVVCWNFVLYKTVIYKN